MILGKWPTWRKILFYVFISILYMFRATSCSSSGESIVSIQHLVYVILCRWPFRMQVGKDLTDLHTKRSPSQSDIYQMLYWCNWFSWWWARGCLKHVFPTCTRNGHRHRLTCTRCCIDTIDSPDDEHGVVENWKKYTEKKCASSWSFTENQSRMHGQQKTKLLTAISLPCDRLFQQRQPVLITPNFPTRIWMLLPAHTLHVIHDRCVTLVVAVQICSREWQAKVVTGRTSFANRCFN